MILNLVSSSILLVNPHSHTPRRHGKNTPSISIDLNLPPTPVQQISPSLARVLGTNEHSFGGVRPVVRHENSETGFNGCRIAVGEIPKSGEADTMWVVKVVKLPSVRIKFAGEDDLWKDLTTKWRFHEALAIWSGIAVEVAVEDAWESAVNAEEDESIC